MGQESNPAVARFLDKQMEMLSWMHSQYRSINHKEAPHAFDSIFFPGALEIMHWVDKHPELQKAIHDFDKDREDLRDSNERTVRLWADATQMLPRDRETFEQ